MAHIRPHFSFIGKFPDIDNNTSDNILNYPSIVIESSFVEAIDPKEFNLSIVISYGIDLYT